LGGDFNAILNPV